MVELLTTSKLSKDAKQEAYHDKISSKDKS